jgi:hypothetical protein
VGHGRPRQPGGAAQLEGIESRPHRRQRPDLHRRPRYQSAGAGSYPDTNYLPSAHGINYTLNAACFGLWSLTGDSSTNWDIGGASGAQLVRMRCRSGSNTSLRINSSAADESFANSDGSGLFVANRSGASATQCYRNGASLGSGTAAATTIPGGLGNLFVCAMNPHEANPSIRQQALIG